MFVNEESENSPLLYYSVGIAVVVSTIYGIIALFTGEGEQGVFILTISVLFYVAIYHRLFGEDSNIQ